MLESALGKRVGASHRNQLRRHAAGAAGMREAGDRPIVTLICDNGERYRDSYYSDAWVTEHGLDLTPHTEHLQRVLDGAFWTEE